MPPRHNEDITTSRFWKEFSSTSSPALGTALPLYEVNGSNERPCKAVTMLESGTLQVLNADGVDCSIDTVLPTGMQLVIEVGTIKAEQTAAILVQW